MTRVEKVGGDLVVNEIGRDDAAETFFRCAFGGLEDNLELRAELGFGTGLVGVAENFFPESSTGRKEGVVGNKVDFIGRSEC